MYVATLSQDIMTAISGISGVSSDDVDVHFDDSTDHFVVEVAGMASAQAAAQISQQLQEILLQARFNGDANLSPYVVAVASGFPQTSTVSVPICSGHSMMMSCHSMMMTTTT